MAEGLYCEHGCKPEREVSREKVSVLLKKLAKLDTGA
jgi:hypothetical protein